MAQVVGVSDPHTAMADMTVKETLRTNTAAAIADGVFGVPTFVIEGEVFWGDDATEMMLDYLANAALFKTAEMQRISNMPMGLTRPK
jgi:2-hydroxychromene-2-carboxylate isomerase